MVVNIARIAVAFGTLVQPTGMKPDSSSPQRQVVRGELNDLKVIASDAEDLGTLPVGKEATRKIVFANSGTARLSLSVVGTTCGCTKAGFSVADVGPGETTVLAVTVAVPPVTQRQNQSVTFRVTGDGRPEQRGVVVVSYRPDWTVEITPPYIGMTVVQGSEAWASLSVRQEGEFVFPVGSFVSSVEGVAFGEPVTRLSGDEYGTIKEVPIRVLAREKGTFAGWLAPKTEAENAARPVMFAVRVLEPWRAQPGGLVLQLRSDSPTQRRLLRLLPRREGAAVPVAMEVRPPHAGVAVTLGSLQGGHSLDLTIKPEGFREPWAGTIVVMDQDSHELVSIPLAVFPRVDGKAR